MNKYDKIKIIDATVMIIKLFVNLFCILVLFFLFVASGKKATYVPNKELYDKTYHFFREESKKNKNILLKGDSYKQNLFLQEMQSCQIVMKTKLISEVNCDKK